MKDLFLIKVLEFYDIPQVFLGGDKDKNYYVCTLFEAKKNWGYKYVAAQVSLNRLKELFNGSISLRSIYVEHEKDKTLFIVFVIKDEITALELPDSDLKETMLPGEGFRFDPSEFVQEKSKQNEKTYLSVKDISEMINSKNKEKDTQV